MAEKDNGWTVLNVKSMKVRKGSREGWMECLLEVEGKEVKKLVMKKVDRFWSERSSVEEFV